MKDSDLTHAVIGAAIEIHRNLGPGLLEAVYEECLARELTLSDISFERQKPIPLVYKDLKLECGIVSIFSWLVVLSSRLSRD